MARQLFFDINTEGGKWFDHASPTYDLPESSQPKIKLGEKVVFCLSLYDADGVELALNAGDTFDLAIDDDFDHDTTPLVSADNTSVDVAGDWADIDRATGKISVRCTIDSSALRTAIDDDSELLNSKIQLRRYEAVSGDISYYLIDGIKLYNVLTIAVVVPPDPDPGYLTLSQLNAILVGYDPYTDTFTYSDVVAGNLVVAHNKNTLDPFVVMQDSAGVMINPPWTRTDANTVTVDMSAWGVFAGIYRISIRK